MVLFYDTVCGESAVGLPEKSVNLAIIPQLPTASDRQEGSPEKEKARQLRRVKNRGVEQLSLFVVCKNDWLFTLGA